MELKIGERVHYVVKEGGNHFCLSATVIGPRDPLKVMSPVTNTLVQAEDDGNPMGTLKLRAPQTVAHTGFATFDVDHSADKPFASTWHTWDECNNEAGTVTVPNE